MARVGVIGGGAFGTALACVVRRAGHDTTIWAREPEVAWEINEHGQNPVYLPRVRLVPGIIATNDLAAAARNVDFLLLAPPAQRMRSVTAELRPHLADGTPVITCSKGIENGSSALMSQVIEETLPTARIAVLSGPSFANEISVDLPAGVTLACSDVKLAEKLAHAIGTPRFRAYVSDDIVGTLIGGALKNVFAIACGVASGKKLGQSAGATIVARALAEMVRLGLAMGARQETFMGLSGVGDLDLCCNSPTSRNMSLGIALGEGRELADILAARVTVQEGVHSAESVAALAHRYGLDMPIALSVDAVLNHGVGVEETIARLLTHSVGLERVATF